jgi:hypothetical protein
VAYQSVSCAVLVEINLSRSPIRYRNTTVIADQNVVPTGSGSDSSVSVAKDVVSLRRIHAAVRLANRRRRIASGNAAEVILDFNKRLYHPA